MKLTRPRLRHGLRLRQLGALLLLRRFARARPRL